MWRKMREKHPPRLDPLEHLRARRQSNACLKDTRLDSQVQRALFGFRDLNDFPATHQSREFMSADSLHEARRSQSVNSFHPRDKFLRPVLSSHEIAWDAGSPE